MANVNEFLPVATATGANVISQSAYAASSDRLTGVTRGTASSEKFNKIQRQSSSMTSAIGTFTAARGPRDARDNGDIGALADSFAAAVAQFNDAAKFANDVGVINNYVANLDPAPGTYYEGMTICLVPQSNNTDVAYLSVNGLGNREIRRNNGTLLQSGDLLQGAPVLLRYIGGAVGGFFRLGGLALGEAQRIVSNSILYVRTDGSDANKGSDNTPSKAFASIGAAYNYGIVYLVLTGQPLTIQLGTPGTYAAPGGLRPNSNIVIQGDLSNQAAYTISGSLGASGSAGVDFRGCTFQNNSASGNCLTTNGGINIALLNVTLTTTTTTTGVHINAGPGSTVNVQAGCIFSGSSSALFSAGGGVINFAPAVVIVQGSPTFSIAAAYANGGGQIFVTPGCSFSGAATGTRYFANLNGVIVVYGAGESVFPGTVAGVKQNGGQYA